MHKRKKPLTTAALLAALLFPGVTMSADTPFMNKSWILPNIEKVNK